DCFDNDPFGYNCPFQGTSNNYMDLYPSTGGSFSQCQIGKMHYYLSGNAGNIRATVINNDCDVAGDAFVIETGRNVVWTYHNTMAGDLIIEPGSVLTIRCTIRMKPQHKIIVKRGARLIIDGGIITSACSDPWRGIEVWGNTALGQIPPSNQGWVRVINGGTVEKSSMGIYTNRTDEETGGWIPGYTGGIVQATDAKFINNVYAVQFFTYDNYNSLSSFTNCEFVTDGNRPEGPQNAYFVTIIGINGIAFTACRFLNQSGLEYYQSGIRSANSFVRIQGKCLDIFDPCINWEYGKFEGLIYGVYVTATSPTRYADIRHTEFKNNLSGLYLSGITNARVTSNRFIINTPFMNRGYGMYLDYCTGYWIEDNDFKHDGTTPKGIGLIVNNSGTDPNEIYRNRFEKLEMGISAQGINRNPATGVGLQILCNDFIVCNADILIVNSDYLSNRGIAANQGAGLPQPQAMAGNLFHIHPEMPDDFDDINNEGAHITYYYPSNYESGYGRVEPIDYTENTVTKVGLPFSPPWSPATGCPSKLESGNGGSQSATLKEQISGTQQKIDSTHQILALLIDGGNTAGLQMDVNMSFPPEAMQVYSELMSKSPYLSDTVVGTAIFKENVLPGAMIRDMMVANPHTAKSEALMEKLDQRWIPLPGYMKAQILQGKSIVSAREQTESRLARFALEKARAVNALARVYNENTDSLAWLWANDNSLSSKYNLAFLLLERSSPDQGLAIMNNIPQQFTLTQAQQTAHQQLTGFCSLLASLMQDEKSIFELDSQQLLSIAVMEATQAGMASVYARNILLTLGMMEYDEPILLPDLFKSKALAQRSLAMKNSETPTRLIVFPNPARGYIIAEYMLPAQGNGVIEFTDISGKRMQSVLIKHMQDQITLDVREWKSGLYVATLKTGTKITQSVKFTIAD
ncbi:MAG: T9SS type A sorting domain-containing protein, partial [Bacteroidales bacterium]|nr:T9SS type A sorting domain-containing protein [Bacteroidales bacterium]